MAPWEGLCHHIAGQYFAPGLEHADLVQEARFGAYKGVRDYRAGHGTELRTFVASCARRQVLTAVQAATRGKHGPLNRALTELPDEEGQPSPATELLAADSTHDPYLCAVRREERAELAQRLRGLSALELQVLRLRAVGYSYGLIGARCELGRKGVDNALQRARRKLVAA